ncbi:MAG: type II toxin-antitoxin system RelE/ParE family toxin [Bacteroidota bacterium]|nr:type II toxin-antitoxin system RelE/ParE family toxin [Bacteroidota bacterium]
MKIQFKSKKLEKQLTESKEVVRCFGPMAKKVVQRMAELKAAENLNVMRTIPAARCHELYGVRKGQLAVDISPNYRLIFQPANEPIPLKDDGGLNWILITCIEIITTEDYH